MVAPARPSIAVFHEAPKVVVSDVSMSMLRSAVSQYAEREVPPTVISAARPCLKAMSCSLQPSERYGEIDADRRACYVEGCPDVPANRSSNRDALCPSGRLRRKGSDGCPSRRTVSRVFNRHDYRVGRRDREDVKVSNSTSCGGCSTVEIGTRAVSGDSSGTVKNLAEADSALGL